MDLTNEKVLELYEKELLSVKEIAKRFDTYDNKILRMLKKVGAKMRSKSEAQKVALQKNRHKHPTKGRHHSEESKLKISKSIHNVWSKMTDKEKKRRSKLAKDQWDSMTEQEQIDLRKMAADAVRVAAKEGSKIEKFLFSELKKQGEQVIFHKKGLIPNENLEIDLFLPSYNLIVEIDGPAHFFPIWGEEKLQKHIKSDADKNGLLISYKYNVLRIKYMSKNVSIKHKANIINKIKDVIKIIKDKNKKLSVEERYFELEVK